VTVVSFVFGGFLPINRKDHYDKSHAKSITYPIKAPVLQSICRFSRAGAFQNGRISMLRSFLISSTWPCRIWSQGGTGAPHPALWRDEIDDAMRAVCELSERGYYT
jgi:hypothetical protein